MDSIENNLSLLLEGLALQDSEELCDFSLADQNEAIGTRFCFHTLCIVTRCRSISYSKFKLIRPLGQVSNEYTS